METIIAIDEFIFKIINQDLHNQVLDFIMPYWRDKTFWIPFYVALAVFLVYRFRVKGLYMILAIGLTAGIADTVSSHVIKKTVKRIRPCNQEQLKGEVELLVRCGTGYSFTSSHATNHFAIATFLSLTLGLLYRKIRLPLFLWAASIALGQVYVGVHFPFDILAGSLLGIFIGWGMAKLFNRFELFKLE